MAAVSEHTTVQFILSYGSIAAIIGWVLFEIRADYRKTKAKIDEKLDKTECEKFREDEKEARIREREAVRADREVRGNANH